MLLAMLRTFLVFFVGGLLMITAVVSLFLIGDIIWLDCLHENPGRPCGDAMLLAAVSPIYGIAIGMAVSFLPLIVGAVLAVIGRAVFRRVPLWYVVAMLPACVLAYFAQGSPGFPNGELRPDLMMFSTCQAAALMFCWWWDRRATWT